MQASMQTVELEIGGMDSDRACRGVRSALNCIRGVARIAMEPHTRGVTVTYDAFKVAPRQFETAVRVMGCEVEHMTGCDSRALPAGMALVPKSPLPPARRPALHEE